MKIFTTEELTELLRTKTELEIMIILEGYKQLTVQGQVTSVSSPSHDNSIDVQLEMDFGAIYLTFSGEHRGFLANLHKGDEISVLGKFERVGGYEIHVKECEILLQP